MVSIESQLDDFMDTSKWHRNHRGSLCRRWNEYTVSVFYKWGSYRWVITGTPGVFSPGGYKTEDDAMFGLAKEFIYEG